MQSAVIVLIALLIHKLTNTFMSWKVYSELQPSSFYGISRCKKHKSKILVYSDFVLASCAQLSYCKWSIDVLCCKCYWIRKLTIQLLVLPKYRSPCNYNAPWFFFSLCHQVNTKEPKTKIFVTPSTQNLGIALWAFTIIVIVVLIVFIIVVITLSSPS